MLGPEDWKVKADERSERVLHVMRQVGTPLEAADIKSATGMDKEALYKTLNYLVETKVLTCSGSGVRGNPVVYKLGIF